MHEAQMHDENLFVTLTYAETGYSLCYRDFQLFMKRLRKEVGKVRFYMCGEYGETNSRPHFHACLFGVGFHDRVPYSSRGGVRLYTSPTLDRLWSHGLAVFGDVTFESASYVARYVMKKLTGDGNADYYDIFDPMTGEIFPRVKEFARMSLKPGIGRPWFDKFASDVYPRDQVVVRGEAAKPPRYYDKLREKDFPDEMELIKYKRLLDSMLHVDDNTNARLADRKTVATARANLFQRDV